MKVLPFPVKIYIFEILTRATPGSSLVLDKLNKIRVFLFNCNNKTDEIFFRLQKLTLHLTLLLTVKGFFVIKK